MNNVLIGTPSCREPKWAFVMSLLRQGWGKKADELGLGFHMTTSSSLNENRRCIVEEGKRGGYKYILWIDDDMWFPIDTVERLLKHDLPIVGCNCTCRGLPLWTTAIIGNPPNQQRITSLGKTGLQEVDFVGFGVIMTETAIFDKLPQPWFATPYDPNYSEERKTVSEDVWFCWLAKKHGYKIFIDHDLSQQIEHIGEFAYHHRMVVNE